MTTKPTAQPQQPRRRSPMEQVVFALHRANRATTWVDFAASVQVAELAIDSFRFRGARLLLNRPPTAMAMRALELARLFSAWADEIEDPAQPADRVAAIEELIAQMKLKVARAATNRLHHATDATFLRAALCDTVERVAALARGPWKDNISKDPATIWIILADEVIRLYGENLDPARVPLMRKERHAIATALEACSNRGGRGKIARVHKSEAVVELCTRLGFPAPDYDSITKGSKRKPRAKNKQG